MNSRAESDLHASYGFEAHPPLDRPAGLRTGLWYCSFACPSPPPCDSITTSMLTRKVEFIRQSGAYYDVWLDGEKFMSATRENPEVTKARLDNTYGTNFEGSPEPLYGTQFLPRKFKVAVTVRACACFCPSCTIPSRRRLLFAASLCHSRFGEQGGGS